MQSRTLVIAVAMCLVAGSAAATVCDITSYGAVPGPCTACASTNSQALQAAFTACNNGGTVMVPSGIFPTEPTEIEHINGTTVSFDGFIEALPNGQVSGNSALIKMKHATKITLIGTGGGLNGQGSTYWSGNASVAQEAPPLFELEEATNVKIVNMALVEPGTAALTLKVCTSVYIESLNVGTNGMAPSPFVVGVLLKDTCSDISVDAAAITAGHSCVSVSGGWAPGCTSNIRVSDTSCNGAGVHVGPMQVYGGYCIKDVELSEITVMDAEVGVLVATVPNMGPVPTGGALSDVTVNSLTVNQVGTAMNVTETAGPGIHIPSPTGLRGAPAALPPGMVPVPISGVSFNDVGGTVTKAAGSFTGAASAGFTVALSDVDLTLSGTATGFTCVSGAGASTSGQVAPVPPASC